MIETAILATVIFASTNIDDAFVLLAFFANPRVNNTHVVVGQYLGIAAIVLAALACSAISLALPAREVGLLGIVPIVIGVVQLWSAWRGRGDAQDEVTEQAGSVTAISTVTVITIANSADNVAIYIPYFAHETRPALILTLVIFTALVGVWCVGASRMTGHPRLGALIRRWAHWIAPLVFIALGVYILISSGAVG